MFIISGHFFFFRILANNIQALGELSENSNLDKIVAICTTDVWDLLNMKLN